MASPDGRDPATQAVTARVVPVSSVLPSRYTSSVSYGPGPDGWPPALVARSYRSGCWLVIEADGELDIVTVPLLGPLLRGDTAHVVFDLRRVTFIDARGLGLLAATRNNLGNAHGAVRVAGPSPHTRKLLALTALDKQVAVFGSLDEALAGHASCR